ncbi:Uncharacterised protein g9601 [Pycnogonum litorale]
MLVLCFVDDVDGARGVGSRGAGSQSYRNRRTSMQTRSSKGVNTWVIVAIVGGTLFGTILIFCVCYYICRNFNG